MTFNQFTRLKHYLTSICTIGYYYHSSEQRKTLYDSADNMRLDNTLPVPPKHAGHNFPNTFMMDVCIYNQILNRKTHHVSWKAMALALLDAIMRQLTYINAFVMEAIWNPTELCLSGIRRSRRFVSMPSGNPIII